MSPDIITRELRRDEFRYADMAWIPYHETKGDPDQDRIFAVFETGEIVSLARCRRYNDGYEVDGVFTPEDKRGRGYAGMAMDALVEACQHDTLYMYAVLDLVPWYGKYGFIAIDENELPPAIRARYAFAQGELNGANVQPMKRLPGRPQKRRPPLQGAGMQV